MNQTDIRLMRRALVLARQSLREDQMPVGCVISRHGRIIGRGRKQGANHARLDHAEMLALRAAIPVDQYKSPGLSLYTTLEPCIMCFGAIINIGISRVIFALEDPYGGATGLGLDSIHRHADQPPEIIRGVCRTEARRLFAQYFRTTANPFWNSHPDNPLCQICRQPRRRTICTQP